MKIEVWLFAISVVTSIICGMKMKSKCCGKECSISVEREVQENETLRSIRIGRRQTVQPRLELPGLQSTSEPGSL